MRGRRVGGGALSTSKGVECAKKYFCDDSLFVFLNLWKPAHNELKLITLQ